jgi:acyl-CoA dehydrogenase
MKTKLHAARLLCRQAAWRSDAGVATALDISMAKLQGTRSARAICGECMEIAGRISAGDMLILEKLFRDMKALDVMEGTADIHRLIIARELRSQAGAAALT